MDVSRSTAVRQAVTFTSIVFALVLALALAFPHAKAVPVLSLFTPVLTVLLITLAPGSRGTRRQIWRGIGLRHPGLRSWPAAVALPLVFLSVAYGAASVLGVATLRAPDLA